MNTDIFQKIIRVSYNQRLELYFRGRCELWNSWELKYWK